MTILFDTTKLSIKQEAHGPHPHLRKQFKSINTYDYIITLIKRRKKTLLISREFIGSSFEQTWIPYTQGCVVPRWVEIGPVVLEKKMKMWKVYDNDDDNDDGQQTKLTWAFGSGELKSIFWKILPFCNYLPLEKWMVLSFNLPELPSSKNALHQV